MSPLPPCPHSTLASWGPPGEWRCLLCGQLLRQVIRTARGIRVVTYEEVEDE